MKLCLAFCLALFNCEIDLIPLPPQPSTYFASREKNKEFQVF